MFIVYYYLILKKNYPALIIIIEIKLFWITILNIIQTYIHTLKPKRFFSLKNNVYYTSTYNAHV